MSRRKRSRAKRDRARASHAEALRLKLEAWEATRPANPPRPAFLALTVRGITLLQAQFAPVRVPFDPTASEPPADLKGRVMDMITSPETGDA